MKQHLLFFLCIAFAGLLGSTERSASPAHTKGPVVAPGQIGSRLPDFTVKDLLGHEIYSADLHGKVVLIDFWATWCQPCKKEMPGYQKLLDRYSARGFVVIGFKFDTMADTEDPLSFARRIGVHYPLAVASDDLKQRFGGMEGLPTTVLYDRKGVLRKKIIGFEYNDVLQSAVQALL